MEIRTSRGFDKNYKKRISSDKRLVAQFLERVVLLEKGEEGALLKIPSLAGSKKGYFAFSVTGDIRVIFQ